MAERERMRLEKGSDYNTDSDIEDRIDEVTDSYYDTEEDEILGDQSKLNNAVMQLDQDSDDDKE